MNQLIRPVQITPEAHLIQSFWSRVQRARRELQDLLEQCCIVELDTIGAVPPRISAL